MLNLGRDLVYSSELGKYAGGSLDTGRAIHVPKVLYEAPEEETYTGRPRRGWAWGLSLHLPKT